MSYQVNIKTNIDSTGSDKSRLSEIGKGLVNQLYVTLKTAQIYQQNNAGFLKQSQNLHQVMAKALEQYPNIYLQLKNGYLYLNDLRLKFDFAGYIGNKYLIDEFQRAQIGMLQIQAGISSREVDKFSYFWSNFDEKVENPYESFQRRLTEIGVTNISIDQLPHEEYQHLSDSSQDNRLVAKKTFFKAISVAQDLMVNAREHKLINLVRAKRLVQSLVDQILKDDKLFLELSTIKSFDEYTFVHSANVAVLSVILGMRLGLDKQELAELGFAALFHDIGKVRLPVDLINKPTELDEADWEQMRQHPVLGVKTILSARQLDDITARAIVVCFEHHMNLDLSGYPKVRARRVLNLHTRVLQVSDAYNAMTSGRVYMKTAIPPHEVLRKMWRLAGKGFDPILLKLFTNIMGIYPVGSLVLLDTDEIAIVHQPNDDNLYRPKVKI
ncbi:MAG: HD-GYP domain-containing protein, partial [candidate division Zixibacteria bacterium]|nr:HD-GYP domain-containing protein [candidate division Zixibacteria bacterium]